MNAVNGCRRVVSSYITHPRDHTSAAKPYLAPLSISGDMKCGVPTVDVAWTSSAALASTTRARPKSPSITSPHELVELVGAWDVPGSNPGGDVRKTLPHLTSRWMTRSEWRYANAERSCASHRRRVCSGNRSRRRLARHAALARSPPSQWRMTMHTVCERSIQLRW